MKNLFPALFAFGLLGTLPAMGQTVPPTSQQIQQQYDQTIQNTNNQTQQAATQTQLGLIQDQQRRDQALAASPPPAYLQPVYPPPPVYVPPPYVPQPKP